MIPVSKVAGDVLCLGYVAQGWYADFGAGVPDLVWVTCRGPQAYNRA